MSRFANMGGRLHGPFGVNFKRTPDELKYRQDEPPSPPSESSSDESYSPSESSSEFESSPLPETCSQAEGSSLSKSVGGEEASQGRRKRSERIKVMNKRKYSGKKRKSVTKKAPPSADDKLMRWWRDHPNNHNPTYRQMVRLARSFKTSKQYVMAWFSCKQHQHKDTTEWRRPSMNRKRPSMNRKRPSMNQT